ncbi:MAG: hypothetical protein KBA16_07910 [Bacteroidia bacterium]|nr:hypothetical protein [Bacteroidia bacterium]MBP7437630.1 hypothetical protein [Bacteroidia bacterium]MBP7728629.1 hypothetical protein [Bacteroidia bacterium]MBP7773263.1 hypothetical protein [Bacteroidia bacterium]
METDSGRVVVHFHQNGKMSTVEWIDRESRFGISYALDAAGKELLRLTTRRFAGHAAVHFSYHANGSIALAEYSNAPDAGIQWYRATYRFDESGNQTGFEEQGHDDFGPLPRPGIRLLETTSPKQEACQIPVIHSYFIVNPLDFPVLVHFIPKLPSPAARDTAFVVYPGESLKGGEWITGDTIADVHVVLQWKLAAMRNRGQFEEVVVERTDLRAAGAKRRSHYLILGLGH